MIKRHPVYPYNISDIGVIMENGFADASDLQLDFKHVTGNLNLFDFNAQVLRCQRVDRV